LLYFFWSLSKRLLTQQTKIALEFYKDFKFQLNMNIH
jgi:hypothetical protein